MKMTNPVQDINLFCPNIKNLFNLTDSQTKLFKRLDFVIDQLH